MLVFDGAWSGQRPEALFACPAYRATPIFWCLLKPGAFGYFAFTIASIRIINTAAIDGLTLKHLFGLGHSKLLCYGCPMILGFQK
jgi:hypothetical protein